MNRLPLVALLLLCARAEEFQIEANIRYSQSSQTVLDILQPRAPALKDRPAVVVIHNKSATKEAAGRNIGQAFIDHGWVVAAVEYREDEAEGDILKAAQWFVRHAAEYRVDRKKIVVCGGRLARSLASRESGVAAIVELDHAEESPAKGRNGGLPILNLNRDTVPDSAFVWLKKHKIQ